MLASQLLQSYGFPTDTVHNPHFKNCGICLKHLQKHEIKKSILGSDSRAIQDSPWGSDLPGTPTYGFDKISKKPHETEKIVVHRGTGGWVAAPRFANGISVPRCPC